MAPPRWYRGERLGKGGYAEVFAAVPAKPGPLMAVKSAPEGKYDSLRNEAYFLQKLAGVGGIIRCYGGDFTGESPRRTYNLLLEYAPHGNLAELISTAGAGIAERYVRVFTRKLLKALNSIHSRRWVHCDIKSDNILVFSPPPGAGRWDYELKIADFGLAVEMRDLDNVWGYRGTLTYMPPEVVSSRQISPAMDVWGLGCTVLEMLTGDGPWMGWKEEEELKVEIGKGGHPRIPDWLSEEAKDFLRMCFEKCSSRRANCRDLLKHPFAGGRRRLKVRVPEPAVETRIPSHLFLPHLMFKSSI
ncbi:Mitogen-activated protein kinase kinase kinase 20 [Linum grandiflorum]